MNKKLYKILLSMCLVVSIISLNFVGVFAQVLPTNTKDDLVHYQPVSIDENVFQAIETSSTISKFLVFKDNKVQLSTTDLSKLNVTKDFLTTFQNGLDKENALIAQGIFTVAVVDSKIILTYHQPTKTAIQGNIITPDIWTINTWYGHSYGLTEHETQVLINGLYLGGAAAAAAFLGLNVGSDLAGALMALGAAAISFDDSLGGNKGIYVCVPTYGPPWITY